MSEAAVVARLLNYCCNAQCGPKLVDEVAGFLEMRRLHDLVPDAVDRRKQLHVVMAGGYKVTHSSCLFCITLALRSLVPVRTRGPLPQVHGEPVCQKAFARAWGLSLYMCSYIAR